MLSPQESLLLRLAEEYLRNLLPASLMNTMSNSFRQARHNLVTQADVIPENEWLTKVRVVSTTQPLLPPTIIPDVFEAVSNALYGNYWLSLTYRNAANKESDIRVMPLGLAQQGPRLYLVCRYQKAGGGTFDNERNLALHRMTRAEVLTAEPFIRPAEFDLKKYDGDGRFGFGTGKRIRLTFLIDKKAGLHLLESPLSDDQEWVAIGDQYEISATVVETEQLEWWLRGFGEQVGDVRRQTIPIASAPGTNS